MRSIVYIFILFSTFEVFAFERSVLCKVSLHSERVELNDYDGKSEIQSKTYPIATIRELGSYSNEFSFETGIFNPYSTNYRVTITLDNKTIALEVIVNWSQGLKKVYKLNQKTTEEYLLELDKPLFLDHGKIERTDGAFEKIQCMLY